MNIDQIIKRVLLEVDEGGIRGFNYKDQEDILEKGRTYCSDFKSQVGDRKVKRLDTQDIVKFPGLAGNTEIAYISSNPLKDGAIIMFFAIVDPSTSKRSFYTYWVKSGQSPKKYTQGWGYDCEQMQEVSELGKDTLSSEQKDQLAGFLKSNPSYYADYPEGAYQGEFEKVPYGDLEWPTTGKKVLPDYKGTGYVYKRRGLTNVNQEKAGQTDVVLNANGFTREEPIDAQSPEANAGFFLKDIAKDLPALAVMATQDPNLKVYPKPNTLKIPNRETCRDVIKLLNKCSKSSTTREECTRDLWKNKILAIQCGDKKFVSGAFGVGDEFNQISTDTGKYGIANLRNAIQQGFDRSEPTPNPKFEIRENLKKKITKLLNEEYKRRNFLK